MSVAPPTVSRVLSCLGLTVLAACAGPVGTRVTPAELAAAERRAAEQGAPRPGPALDDAEPDEARARDPEPRLSGKRSRERDEFDERRLKLDRRREDHARSGLELEEKRVRTTLQHASQTADETIRIVKAEREHRHAAEDLAHFVEVEHARRLAEDELSLRASADALLETREELAQLEMMYGESDLGDATAEIVLNRTRRRLERAEERHRLREERSAELLSIELPRERERLELELQTRQVALENAQRDRDVGRIKRDSELRELEQDALKRVREVEDIERDGRNLQRDIELWERELAVDAALADAGRSGA